MAGARGPAGAAAEGASRMPGPCTRNASWWRAGGRRDTEDLPSCACLGCVCMCVRVRVHVCVCVYGILSVCLSVCLSRSVLSRCVTCARFLDQRQVQARSRPVLCLARASQCCVMAIRLDTKERPTASSVLHHMPCEIHSTGPAPVSMYFRPSGACPSLLSSCPSDSPWLSLTRL